MTQLQLQTGKMFYGFGMAGIGVLNFCFPGFRDVLLPFHPDVTPILNLLTFITGMTLAVTALYIVFGKRVKTVALCLGFVLLLLLVFVQLPYRFINGYYKEMGEFTNTLKLCSLTGGAFIVAGFYPWHPRHPFLQFIERIAPYGKYLFALMLVCFGIDHFIYIDFVSSLVPKWIGASVFWSHFTGVALFGAGIAIFINFKPNIISVLLAIMLFIWFLTIHIPGALNASPKYKEPNWNGVFQCLAFSGIALLYPFTKAPVMKEPKN